MQPRTALFDLTVTSSHQLAVRADILTGGVVVATGLPISAGSVVGDRAPFARRTCTVTIAGTQWIPKATTDYLTPYGNEIRLWRGVTYPSGATEVIPLGTFGIRDVEIDSPQTSVIVTGIDRSKAVSEARFLTPRTILAGASVVATITSFLTQAVPQAAVIVDPNIVDIPMQQVTYDQERDKAIIDLATSLGGEVFADPLGAFHLQLIPDPTTAPVFTVSAGPGGVMVQSKRHLTRDYGFNGVVATGSATSGTAPSAIVIDTDPTSPTYWYGTYGQVPAYYTSSLLTTTAQCQVAAVGILQDLTGVAKSVDLTAVPNPALEPGDVISCVFPGGTVEQHILDAVTIPLTADQPMTASTRAAPAVATKRLSPHIAGLS